MKKSFSLRRNNGGGCLCCENSTPHQNTEESARAVPRRARSQLYILLDHSSERNAEEE